MQFETVERDFVERTLEVLRQYDQFVMLSIAKKEQYEVTLLLNCLLGLIILPFEHLNRTQDAKGQPSICKEDDTPISDLDEEWGLGRLEVRKFIDHGNEVPEEERTLRKTFAMFRHSLAHTRFDDGQGTIPEGLSVRYSTAADNPVESIIVEANLNNTYRNTEFVATIKVADLRKFATKLAKTFLAEIKRQRGK